MGGYLSSLQGFFSFLTLLLVNPNDNLRIFDFLKKNNPSIYKRSLSLIKESYNILVLLVHQLFDWPIKNVVGIAQFLRHFQEVVEYIPQLLHNVARVMEYIPQLLEKIKQILQMLGE